MVRRFFMYVVAASLAMAAALASGPPVVMKVLVLAGSTNETSYQSITAYLTQIGVPYQAVALNSITPDSSGNRMSKVPLTNSSLGEGLYQGIILTDSTFAACGSSCLSTADWTTLNTYASQYSVRVASYYTDPAAQWGLLPADSGASYTAASPLNVTLTAAGAAVFPYLNPANPIPVAGQGSSAIRAYRATTTAATNETTTSLLTAGSYVVAVTHTTADGREVLALTMDNSPALLHSLAFGYGVVNWVTKGVFLGSRKVYLNPQIDDMLLGNWIYAPTLHPACENPNTCPTYVATGPDLQAMANWQAGVQSDPLFQSFRGTYGVNGVGTTWWPANDPIFAAIKSLSSKFWWVSHTWDHPNLDCYTTTQNGTCVPATLAQSLAELNQNIAVAPQLGITFDSVGMVTPYNSGLSNASFLQAALQTGIKYIVFPQYPATPNVGIVDAVNPSILELTRMNNNLFDDASSPSTGVYGSWPDEYNAQYGPQGATPLYSQNQTYSQILDNESQAFLQTDMLTYSPYLLAFHIANAATYDGVHSPYSDLLDATIKKYENIFNLPVLTMDMEDIAAVMISRANYNASGVTGVYTPGVSVVLTTSKAATIPVTGICSQDSCGTYGGQIQDSVAMAVNSTVTIPLTSNVGVSLASVSVSPSTVTGGTSVTGSVTLTGAAPSEGVSVSLESNNAAVTVPASVAVGAGSTTATFTVSTASVSSSVSATLTASYNGVSKTATLSVTAAAPTVTLSSVSVNPSSVTGGTSATGTVTLSGTAPSGGLSVALASNNASVTLPAAVTVAAGSSTANFAVATSTVSSTASATLTASYGGVNKTTSLSVTATAPTVTLSSVSVSPSSVTGGTSATGTVTLSGAAPSGGVSVSLASNNASVTLPATVTVAAGSSTANFTATTSTVTSTVSATLTASYSGVSKTTTLSVTAAAPTVKLSSVSVSPSSVTGGTSATGTVTLSGAAPSGGVSVSLASNNASVTLPATVTVVAGSSTGNFTVATGAVTSTASAKLTASYSGVSKTTTLSVKAGAPTVTLSSVSVSPSSVTGGTSATGTVTLSGAAPSGGVSVSLASNNALVTLPATVKVAAGSSTGNFTVATGAVTSTVSATLTASYSGVSKTMSLNVLPAASVTVASVSLNPTSVTSGASSSGTVTLSGAAPAGGVVVSLSSNYASATLPASVTVAAGSKTGSFTVATHSVAYITPVNVTATYNSASASATLTVHPSASVALASVSVSPASVAGEVSTTGTVTLNTAAPAGGVAVELWTTGTVAFVPDTVTVPAGSTTGTFPVATNYTTSTLQDTITAFYNGATKTAGVTVTASK